MCACVCVRAYVCLPVCLLVYPWAGRSLCKNVCLGLVYDRVLLGLSLVGVRLRLCVSLSSSQLVYLSIAPPLRWQASLIIHLSVYSSPLTPLPLFFCASD